jgi:hypothetical protein
LRNEPQLTLARVGSRDDRTRVAIRRLVGSYCQVLGWIGILVPCLNVPTAGHCFGLPKLGELCRMPELARDPDLPIPMAIVCPKCDEIYRITYPRKQYRIE